MGKAVSPAVGFNDNVRRRNRNFHVQTEDSGVAHPHIITHLFTDGGRIVKSIRQSYVDILGEENLAKRVRERMKTQHVGMLEALKSGEYDALVWGSRAPGAKPKPAPASSAAIPEPPNSAAISSQGAVSAAVESSVQPAPVAEAPEPARLPAPPRRSTPPQARKPQPPARKTMPRIDAATLPTPAAQVVPARPRKSVPPKPRRSSRPPPPRSASRPAVVNPRDGLVSQTLDEVILRMLSEEQDSKSGS